jgi:hypothetical protein
LGVELQPAINSAVNPTDRNVVSFMVSFINFMWGILAVELSRKQ